MVSHIVTLGTSLILFDIVGRCPTLSMFNMGLLMQSNDGNQLMTAIDFVKIGRFPPIAHRRGGFFDDLWADSC